MAEAGWASHDGRTFIFRYVLSGFAGLLFLLMYLAIFWPTAFTATVAFAVAAETLAIALGGLAIVFIGAIVRAFSVDRLKMWRLEEQFFRPEYRKMNQAAMEAASKLGLSFDWVEKDEEVEAQRRGRDRFRSVRIMILGPERSGRILKRAERDVSKADVVKARSAWLYFQYDVLRSPGIAYFEAGFLWWSNCSTLCLTFAAVTLANSIASLILGVSAATVYVGSGAGAALLVFAYLASRRMDAYFRNYMRFAQTALERFSAPTRTITPSPPEGEKKMPTQ